MYVNIMDSCVAITSHVSKTCSFGWSSRLHMYIFRLLLSTGMYYNVDRSKIRNVLHGTLLHVHIPGIGGNLNWNLISVVSVVSVVTVVYVVSVDSVIYVVYA
jgi:hypothetical protein